MSFNYKSFKNSLNAILNKQLTVFNQLPLRSHGGKKRIELLDNLRGIAILLVVIGHMLQGAYIEFDKNLWFRILYSFHMPLFMFISGATATLGIQNIFHESDRGIISVCKLEIQGLYRKAQRLLLPFLHGE
jgi:uncharacterized membrane protein